METEETFAGIAAEATGSNPDCRKTIVIALFDKGKTCEIKLTATNHPNVFLTVNISRLQAKTLGNSLLSWAEKTE